MTSTNNPGRDPLDDLLDASSPATSRPSSVVDDEVVRMIVGAEREARPAGVLRHLPRPAAAGVALAIVLGGAGAAAATGTWSPWAQAPDGVLTYTLPSGAQCEQRLGDVRGGRGEVVREFLRTTDLQALVSEGVDDAIAEIRTEENSFVHPDGTREPAGYGTERYNADQEYQSAVWRVINEAVSEELDRSGTDPAEVDLSWGGEANCPGAQW